MAEVDAKDKKTKSKKNKTNGRSVLKTLAILALIAGIGFLGYKYKQANDTIGRLSNPTEQASEEAQSIAQEVSQFFELPNETPSVATVVDATKLQDQSFFSKAQNGDKVLIFPQAKKAILYRQQSKKIIEVAPINVGDQATVNEATTPDKPATEKTSTEKADQPEAEQSQ